MSFGMIRERWYLRERAKSLFSRMHSMQSCSAGLQKAAQLGLRHVVLETDAPLVKTALDDDSFRLSAMGGVTTEIRLLLIMEFVKYKVCVSTLM